MHLSYFVHLPPVNSFELCQKQSYWYSENSVVWDFRQVAQGKEILQCELVQVQTRSFG